MPRFDLRCTACGHELELDIPRDIVKEKYQRKCPECGRVRTFTRVWSKGIAAVHTLYSPMHPRAGRGQG